MNAHNYTEQELLDIEEQRAHWEWVILNTDFRVGPTGISYGTQNYMGFMPMEKRKAIAERLVAMLSVSPISIEA